MGQVASVSFFMLEGKVNFMFTFLLNGKKVWVVSVLSLPGEKTEFVLAFLLLINCLWSVCLGSACCSYFFFFAHSLSPFP